jgi:hypothetical protein
MLRSLIIGLAIASAQWLVIWARKQKARETKGTVIFDGAPFVRFLFTLVGSVMAYGVIEMTFISPEGYYKNGYQWWLPAVGIAMITAIWAVYPRRITLSCSSLSQSSVWGLRTVIKWEEVDCVIVDEEHDAILTYSKGGGCVKHSSLHVDRVRFLSELRMFCEAYRRMVGDL